MPDNRRYVIQIVGLADGNPAPAGLYVQHYSPDGHDGRGDLVLTEDPADAKGYEDAMAAMADWKAVSATHPLRPDGKPNRPLSAFTVQIRQAPDG